MSENQYQVVIEVPSGDVWPLFSYATQDAARACALHIMSLWRNTGARVDCTGVAETAEGRFLAQVRVVLAEGGKR